MKGKVDDVQIDTNITYSIKTESFNKSLKLNNKSDHVYVFKIKTNQKTVISLATTHDFIQPHSVKEIAIKLADKPSGASQLKLEFNYAIATPEDIANNDSKMNAYPKEHIFRLVVPVHPFEDTEQDQRRQQKLKTPQKETSISIVSPLKNIAQKVTKSDVIKEIPAPKLPDSIKVEAKVTTPLLSDSRRVEVNSKIQLSPKVEVSAKIQTSVKTEINSKPQVLTQSQTKSEPKKQVSGVAKVQTRESVQTVSQPIQFKKVVSSEIKVQPIRYPELDVSTSMYFAAKEDMASVSEVRIPISKQNSQSQFELSQLQQKISREKAIIRGLEQSNNANTIYPFPIILILLIISFSVGSLFSYLLF